MTYFVALLTDNDLPFPKVEDRAYVIMPSKKGRCFVCSRRQTLYSSLKRFFNVGVCYDCRMTIWKKEKRKFKKFDSFEKAQDYADAINVVAQL